MDDSSDRFIKSDQALRLVSTSDLCSHGNPKRTCPQCDLDSRKEYMEYVPGDIVAIYGKVIDDTTEQVRVKLFSKTDEYSAWVLKDLLKPDSWSRQDKENIKEMFDELIAGLEKNETFNRYINNESVLTTLSNIKNDLLRK